MIYDNLHNIDIYKGLSSDIYAGLVFLKEVEPNMKVGEYQLNPRVNAIVSEYVTKAENEYGYEAHKKFVDIQCVLAGQEKVACSPVDRLKETKSYDEGIDAAFYTENSTSQPSNLSLLSGYFAIFFPQDGHMPQLCVEEPKLVKKIVVKVEIQ